LRRLAKTRALLGLALLLGLLLPTALGALLLALLGLAFTLGGLGPTATRRLGCLCLGLGLRLGLLPLVFLLLGLVLRPQKLADGHLRGVAAAWTQAQDARVPAGTRRITRPQVVEQLLHHRDVMDLARDQAPRMETVVISLRLCDEPFSVGPQLLGLHEGGANTLPVEECGGEITQQCCPMGRDPTKLTKPDAVSHDAYYFTR